MNKILTTILTFSVFFIFGQTNRFIYQLDWKMAGQEMKTNMVLDIDKDFVKFYDYKFLEMDSINKKFRGNNNRTNTMADQLLIRKRNSSENKTFHDNNFDYFVLSSKDKMNWKVTKETKKLDNYKLQKATTSFGGREWTAWFTPEISIPDGPYKFHGLPGLILKISDKTNTHSFEIISVQKQKSNYFILNENDYKKAKQITLKEYEKMPNHLELFKSQALMGDVIFRDKEQEQKFMRDIDIQIKEKKIHDNNPIEILDVLKN